MAAAATHPCKKICLYNYKGGASKTTIAVNLAAALAAPVDEGGQAKKVLMVDLDPQCNTTQFWNPDTLQDEESDVGKRDWRAAEGLVAMNDPEHTIESDTLHLSKINSEMEAFVNKTLETPLFKMLNARFSLGDDVRLNQLLDEPNTINSVNPTFFRDRLWLLAGSQLIFKFERDITTALEDQTMADKHVKPIGIISYILNTLAKNHNFDVIILDLSPSNSSLNQISALSCEYILPPCNASLYSCGSIYGLLKTVLPGNEGWLGAHKRLVQKQWDPQWEQSENGQQLLPFRLPSSPPTLLPILVTNYGMEMQDGSASVLKAATSGAKKKARLDPATRVPSLPSMRFQPSQFVYTLMSFLEKCDTIQRADGTSGSSEPKISFRTNKGRQVIPFVPAVPVSIAATEALGRPFVEITLNEFAAFYGFEATELETQQNKLKNKSKLLKMLMESNLLDSLDVNANTVFEREVALVKKRYQSLAAWLVNDVLPSN